MKEQEYIGTGRRKTAVSSVRLRPGTGKVDVNGKKFDVYFADPLQREMILSQLQKVASVELSDMVIRVKGGGIQGQAVATRLGLSRALVEEDANRRQDLKSLHYLTRDPR